MPQRKYNDTRIIYRIAKEIELCMSGVYRILDGDAGFSGQHQALVMKLAHT